MTSTEAARELQKLREQERRAWNEYYAVSGRASEAWDRYLALAQRLRAAEAERSAEAS